MALWYETGNGMVKTSFARKRNNCVAFLCGGGPSLKSIDPSLLNGHNRIVFGLNNTYPFIKPDVWLGMDDPSAYRRDIFWQPFIKIMRGGYQNRLCEGMPISHLHNMYYADVAAPENKEDIFKLRAHDVKFVWSKSTLPVALHVIIWMGIKKIYLFGCNLNNSEGDYYENIKLNTEEQEWNKRLYDQQFKYLKFFRDTGAKHNVKLFSCSPDSKINDEIQYVDYRYVISELEKDLPQTTILKHSVQLKKEEDAGKV